MTFIGNQQSVDPDRPWLCHFAFGACHAPHHVAKEWSDKYKGKFDMGWDKYREIVLERQKKLGVVPENAELSPMLEGVQKWDSLSADEKRLFARMAEVYAGFLEHADAQIGRLMAFLEETKALENTLVFVFIGDNGSSGEGTLNGLYNEMSLVTTVSEDPKAVLAKIDNLGLPGSYNHYPIGWALAGNTPFKLCKQYTHFGGTRNPLVVHWPKGIKAKGELRHQFHHVIDIVPTILKAAGVELPPTLNGVRAGAPRRRPDELHVRRRERADDAPHAVLRDAGQPRDRRRQVEGGDLPRPQAVGERRRVGLRRGPLGALRPREGSGGVP